MSHKPVSGRARQYTPRAGTINQSDVSGMPVKDLIQEITLSLYILENRGQWNKRGQD